MPKEYFKKKGQSNSFKIGNPYGPPLKHFVDDNREHQDTFGDDHNAQTPEEHNALTSGGGEGTRTHWSDGTKRTEREMFDYDETKTEEGKDTPLEQQDVLGTTVDPTMLSSTAMNPTLGGGVNTASGMPYKKKKK